MISVKIYSTLFCIIYTKQKSFLLSPENSRIRKGTHHFPSVVGERTFFFVISRQWILANLADKFSFDCAPKFRERCPLGAFLSRHFRQWRVFFLNIFRQSNLGALWPHSAYHIALTLKVLFILFYTSKAVSNVHRQCPNCLGGKRFVRLINSETII